MDCSNLDLIISRASQWLSYQGPLRDFVCQNPLKAFQNKTFHQALQSAARLYGTYTYLPLDHYRAQYKNGFISAAAMQRSSQWNSSSPEEANELIEQMLSFPAGSSERKSSLLRNGIRQKWKSEFHIHLRHKAQPLLLRLLSAFTDQGVAIWSMPGSENLGFYDAVRFITKRSFKGFPPFNTKLCRVMLEMDPDKSIDYALKRLVGRSKYFETYILEMLLSLPGWSAMVKQVESNPGVLIKQRPLTLKDYLAVSLILEVGVIADHLGDDFLPLKVEEEFKTFDANFQFKPTPVERIKMCWNDAVEWSWYEQALKLVSLGTAIPSDKSSIQGIFCIDDRECSLRRHLELLDRRIETFGTAGFFGMEFMYQCEDDLVASKQCPIVLSPKHLVLGLAKKRRSGHRNSLAKLDRASHSLLSGWLLEQGLGLISAFKLALAFLRPRIDQTTASSVSRFADQTVLQLLFDEKNPQHQEWQLGFTPTELADRIESQLRTMGMTEHLAPLVAVIGHGSSTVNNPHYSAYDCGACTGKPGSPNARVFAQAANFPAVRAILAARGLHIPGETLFIAGLHDTTRDEVLFYDVENLSTLHSELFTRLQQQLAHALKNNALERCRRFELAREHMSPSKALAAVKKRSVSIFEARPEYTHAGNCLAIVGRRQLTRGVFFDRRAFLNSYDPFQDPDGSLLASILAALVPVGGGINLTYYFSKMDNTVYGSGTKLPHNVVGLVGVSNGTEGDLLTGLPRQMVEIHEPIRLLVIVDQNPTIALQAAQKNPAIYEWIKNEWVRFAAVDPATRRVFVFREDAMQEIDVKELGDVSVVHKVEQCYRGYSGPQKFSRVLGRGV